MTVPNEKESRAILRFRIVLGLFIAGLVASGMSAVPLPREIKILATSMGVNEGADPTRYSAVQQWLLVVKVGLGDMYARYPWVAYGTDWLAFGHFAIAIFFVGAL